MVLNIRDIKHNTFWCMLMYIVLVDLLAFRDYYFELFNTGHDNNTPHFK